MVVPDTLLRHLNGRYVHIQVARTIHCISTNLAEMQLGKSQRSVNCVTSTVNTKPGCRATIRNQIRINLESLALGLILFDFYHVAVQPGFALKDLFT